MHGAWHIPYTVGHTMTLVDFRDMLFSSVTVGVDSRPKARGGNVRSRSLQRCDV